MLEGDFSFTRGDEEVVLRRGDLYRVPAGEPHGVRCRDQAVIAQVRETRGTKPGSTCCG